MEFQAQLTLDTGPFAAALADALKAVEKLAGETGGLAAAVEEARSRLAGLGDEANAAAGAQETAARAAEELSGAQKKGAEIAAELAKRHREAGEAAEGSASGFDSARAGLSGYGAASAAMSGNVSGAARGILQLREAMKGPAAAAGLAGIAFGAWAAAIQRTLDRIRQLKQERLDNIFDNASNSAKGLAAEIAGANRELERQNNLKRALAGVADDGRRAAQEAELAKLEAERQKALTESGFDEEDAQINREFDRRKAEIEYRHARENASAGMEADKAQRAENAAGIETRKSQIDELTAEIAAALKKARDFGAAGNTDEQRRWNELAASMTAQAAKLRGEMDALEDANEVLDAKLANWGDAYGFNANGWRLAAENSRIDAEETRSRREIVDGDSLRRQGLGAEPDDKTIRRHGGQTFLTDSLARIGGYVGAAAGRDPAAERAQRERENQTRILQTIERNTRNGGTAVLG